MSEHKRCTHCGRMWPGKICPDCKTNNEIVEIKPENKLCWFCQHFYYREASPGYSEWTPGSNFYIDCSKNHWEFSAYHTSQEEFGKMLTSARNCPDFVPLKNLTK